ncbi:hypothetical protein NECAME_08680 [Necator americanus]|uniref:Liver-expressed antimicrobial peptide 2 n=1 Tax=Necator americanus TaxID=51031 RepID=W2TGN2_NECAM|nr:hypothetical protein NECAME_08680 [Necator americanus]ETN81200.1 hypothetical protein NECAME_08680 [Necator americanus]
MVGKVILFFALLSIGHSQIAHTDSWLSASNEEERLAPLFFRKRSDPSKRSICWCRHKLCPLGTRCAVPLLDQGFRSA